MADLDSVIMRCVDDIWLQYDTQGVGYLDKPATHKFMMDVLTKMSDSFQFSDEDFEKCFEDFDDDASGTIEKEEMILFIKGVAGV